MKRFITLILLLPAIAGCAGLYFPGNQAPGWEGRDTVRAPRAREKPARKPIVKPLAEQRGLLTPRPIPDDASRGIEGAGESDTPDPYVSPAVLTLLEQAKREAAAGEGEQAAATLERALGIEPRNPWLWHRLAVLRLQQGFWKEALHLASKSNTLAEGKHRLLGGNWEVIARALARLGDAEGARKAKLNSQTYFERVGSW